MPRLHLPARDLAQIAIFAALIAALGIPGKIVVSGIGVSITFQTLGVMLAGAILGARKGFLAVLVFHLLTVAGLPLLAGLRGGPSWYLTSPSAGYFYGWLLGVVVIGLLTRLILPRYPLWAGIAATALGGMLVIYAIGVPWNAARLHLSLWHTFLASLVFWPGDAAKVVVTAFVARQVHRAYPGLIPARTTGLAPAAR